MKTLAEMIAVMQAALDGKPIECGSLDNRWPWVLNDKPAWDWGAFDYRVAVTKPSVDWSVLSKEVVAIATDECGNSWIFEVVPTLGKFCWSGIGLARANYIASFAPGTCDWRDSLIVRPEGV